MACDCIVSGDMMEQFEAAPFTLSRGGKGKRRENSSRPPAAGRLLRFSLSLSHFGSRCTLLFERWACRGELCWIYCPSFVSRRVSYFIFLPLSIARFFHCVLYGVHTSVYLVTVSPLHPSLFSCSFSIFSNFFFLIFSFFFFCLLL